MKITAQWQYWVMRSQITCTSLICHRHLHRYSRIEEFSRDTVHWRRAQWSKRTTHADRWLIGTRPLLAPIDAGTDHELLIFILYHAIVYGCWITTTMSFIHLCFTQTIVNTTVSYSAANLIIQNSINCIMCRFNLNECQLLQPKVFVTVILLHCIITTKRPIFGSLAITLIRTNRF